jgi:hypothetical protein
MKKALLVLAVLLFLGTVASAQVLDDFNTAGSLGIYVENTWGTAIDSVYQTADPTGKSAGALGVAIDLTGKQDKDAIGLTSNSKGRVSSNGASFLVMWVYIPVGSTIPDSLDLQLYYQQSVSWAWTQIDNYVIDIPKGKWYPLSFPIAALSASDSAGHYLSGTNDIGDFGMQIHTYNIQGAQPTWKGVIYIDNITLVGEQPNVLDDFNTAGSLGIYVENTWGTAIDSVYQTADPTGKSAGALGVAIDLTGKQDKDAIGLTSNSKGRVSSNGASFLVMWVYIPVGSTIPDSLDLQLYYQQSVSWAWTQIDNYVIDIPKGKWYPLSFPIAALSASDSAGHYLSGTNDIGDFGMQIHTYNIQGAQPTWKGVIYIDNIGILSTKVGGPPPVWVVASFDASKQGFYVPSYATGTLQRYLDLVTSKPGYVLQGGLNVTGSSSVFAVVRDSVPMSKTVDSIATTISYDIYTPYTMPKNGVVKFFVSAGANDSVAVTDTLGKQITVGGWVTRSITKLDSLAQAGKFDPTKKHRIGVIIYYPAPYDTTKWTGNIELDNFMIEGFASSSQLPDAVGDGNTIARQYKLYNNYPNPFNPSTKIKYEVAKDSKVVIRVYDILGRVVTTLVDEKQAAGSYELDFNASKFASGVYFLKMTAGDYVKTQKMMLLK